MSVVSEANITKWKRILAKEVQAAVAHPKK